MQKYIIEYCPGTKGDLLTGFLNNKITESHINIVGKSPTQSQLKLLGDKNVNPNKEDLIKILKNNKLQFINSHNMAYLVDDSWYELIKDHGYIIKKIVFDMKNYRNIYIEDVFKNAFSGVNINLVNNLSKKIPFIYYKGYLSFNDNLNQREIWDYNSLYKNFDIFDVDPIFKNYDIETYKKLVEKSWLPTEINIRGTDFYPNHYGYDPS